MLTLEKTLISAAELKSLLPINDRFATLRNNAVRDIKNILLGNDKRKLFVVGPCSADDAKATVEFACKLSDVANRVKDKIYIIIRVFTSKPRTRGEGYMGILHTPDPCSHKTDIAQGLYAMRKLHIDVATASGLYTADEMLYPEAVGYIDDVVAYMTVGARSAEDQIHRFVAGSVDFPVGVKNPINGDPHGHADSIYAATVPNEFMYCGSQVSSGGNRYAHAVFRGGVDRNGHNFSNYMPSDVSKAYDIFTKHGVMPAALVDTGHSNGDKDPSKVAGIVNAVLNYAKKDGDYDGFIKGFMLESYLEGGNKQPDENGYGISLTDPCLSLAETERILLDAVDML